jgi:hypothetical protein
MATVGLAHAVRAHEGLVEEIPPPLRIDDLRRRGDANQRIGRGVRRQIGRVERKRFEHRIAGRRLSLRASLNRGEDETSSTAPASDQTALTALS